MNASHSLTGGKLQGLVIYVRYIKKTLGGQSVRLCSLFVKSYVHAVRRREGMNSTLYEIRLG